MHLQGAAARSRVAAEVTKERPDLHMDCLPMHSQHPFVREHSLTEITLTTGKSLRDLLVLMYSLKNRKKSKS